MFCLGVSLKADCVLHNASQELVYNKCADEIVNQAMEGFNGHLFTDLTISPCSLLFEN